MRTKIDIRRAITERGYTITSFCQKFNLKTQNIIQNYIKGNPTIKRLEDLCEKLDCDITEIFYPIEEPTSAKGNNPSESERTEGESGQTMQTEHERLFKYIANTEGQNFNDTTIQLPEEPSAVNTTAFCPHCGAKVRVGVVLLPE